MVQVQSLAQGSSHSGSVETNLTSIHEATRSTPGLAQWGKDLALLLLWCRLAAAAPIRPLVWESPYDMGAAPPQKNSALHIYHIYHFCLKFNLS